VLADRHGRLIAGNKTVEAARRLQLPIQVVETDGRRLVVVQRTDLDLSTDARARQLALADNRIAELDLAWDPAILKQLQAEALDIATLWTEEEFERLLGEGLHGNGTDPDRVIEPGPTTVQRGDLFQLGAHRLLCGDATAPADVARLLGAARPLLMLTDPPYGVAYDPAWRARANPRQRTAIGRVAHDDCAEWGAAFTLFPGDVAYVWHAGLFAGVVAEGLVRAGLTIRAQIIWAKQHFALSRGDYHWGHEPAWYAVRATGRSHWRGDRTQSTVWAVPNLNPMGGTRTGENAVSGHATQKPVRLFEIPILNHAGPDDRLYDPFCGSGTAVIAAEKTGRACDAMDIDPRYVAVTIARWEAFTGQQAVAMPGRAR
jgi:DNA modification methylase